MLHSQSLRYSSMNERQKTGPHASIVDTHALDYILLFILPNMACKIFLSNSLCIDKAT